MPMTIFKRFLLLIFLCSVPLFSAEAQDLQQELARTRAQLEFTRLPAASGPTLLPDEHYVMGPGDALTIEIWNQKLNLHYDLTLNAQGHILIPRMGLIQAGGLTRKQLQIVVLKQARRLQQASVNVAIIMREQRKVQVLITGLVKRPGHYWVYWGTPVLEALRQAGGALDNASIRQLEMQRGDRLALDLFDFHYQGKTTANPRLFGGEHLHIPPLKQRVAIVGEVQQAGVYEIKAGERLEDLLLWAGGPRAAADPQQFMRWSGGLDRSGEAELHPITAQSVLKNGDIVYLQARSLQAVQQSVFIRGQVRQPKLLHWQQGMSLLDALHAAGGELPSADLNHVLISRKHKDGTRTELDVDLLAYLNGNNPQGNPQLQPEDSILLPESFFNVRTVTDLTTLVLSTLGIVSVVVNLVPGQ